MEYNNPNDPWMNTGYDPYKGMSDEERENAGCFQGIIYIVAILIGLLICALFSSCTTTQYIPVIEHHTDTLIQTKVQKDYIWLHDSIMVSEKGDTVKIEKWHTKYVSKDVHDTLYLATHDTIPQPYPVTQYVEKKLSTWQVVLMTIGTLTLMGIIIFVAIKLRRFLPCR